MHTNIQTWHIYYCFVQPNLYAAQIQTHTHTYINTHNTYCSFVAPASGGAERLEVTEKHGVVRIVPVEVNSNLNARTLEQMLDSKKQTHLAAFRYGLQELQRDLSRMCTDEGPSRYAKEFYKERREDMDKTLEGFVKKIMEECKKKFDEHEDRGSEEFAEDETFRSLVTEMLNVKTMAKSKLRLWLQDSGKCIEELYGVSINDAHQQLLGFLKKRMQHEGPGGRQLTALEICKLRGLLDKSVDDGHGLISAAAEGVSSVDLELLLEARGLTSQGQSHDLVLIQALWKSAQFGHSHCIKFLTDAKADIHYRNKHGETALYMAASNGHTEAVKLLLEAGACANVANYDDATALYDASWHGHAETVRMLLEAEADVNAADNRDVTPIYMAAQNGHVETVRILLHAGADANAADNVGFTPLHLAAQNGPADTVRLLIEAGVNISAADNVGLTPIHVAAENGHAGTVRLLLEAGAGANTVDKNDATPLHKTACKGHAETVKALLEAGANVNAAKHDMTTPLYMVAEKGHAEAARLLLEANAGVDTAKGGETPLYVAAQNGHAEIVRVLLEAGADVNAAHDDDTTPLYMAAQFGNEETVRMLLQAGASVNAAINSGSTPLYVAACGHAGTVRLLLDAGANVNAADDDSDTPLHMAAQNGNAETVKALLDAGANVNAATDDDTTPLHNAAHGHAKAVTLLLEAGANVNSADKNGSTPLHIAAQNADIETAETVRILLEFKANVNSLSNDGQTPLYKAAVIQDVDIVRILLEAGANTFHTTSDVSYTLIRKVWISSKKQDFQLLIQAGFDVMVKNSTGETLLMEAVCKEDWQSASSLFSVGGYEMLSAENCLGLTCLDMMPSGWKHDQGAATWIELVQAKDEQCDAFVRDLVQEEGSNPAYLELHTGDKWAVSIKAESALFRDFASVRAGHCMCPSGSAAYYELHVVHMGDTPQWGFCTEAFESVKGCTVDGVGDNESSWGIDGDRLLKWHKKSAPFGGRRWQDGDVIGLACDLRADKHTGITDSQAGTACGGSIWISLNGDFGAPYGQAFHLPKGIKGLFAAFTASYGVAVRCNLGEAPLKHAPPPGEGFMPMCSFSKRP
jgi:ankyrin repeat protein